MVAATYCPESRKSPQILVSIEELRGYFRNAETDLYRSKGFRKILAEFKKQGTLTSEVQAAIKAMCREAIRSTLRQVCCLEPPPVRSELPIAPAASSDAERSPHLAAITEGVITPAPLPLNLPPLETPEATDGTPAPFLSVQDFTFETVTHLSVNPVSVTPEPSTLQGVTPPPAEAEAMADAEAESAEVQAIPAQKRDRPTLNAVNPAYWWSLLHRPKPYVPTPEELRQSQLQAIGKTLQDARLAQNMPLEALHQRTLVARHQIRAIEAGGGKWLPEDIYLKGFIQRMGNELGLDGVALANQLTPLPVPDSQRPSWYSQSPAIAASSLNPTQLYIGYAAVVAGSVWGLSWVSQHPIDGSQIPVLQSALGGQSPSLQPQVAQEGLKIAPQATVDTAGNIKIQFSERRVRSPLAPEKAAMEAVDSQT